MTVEIVIVGMSRCDFGEENGHEERGISRPE